MLAPIQAKATAMSNLAFTLILKSVQQAPSAPKAPSGDPGTQPPTTSLGDSHRVDVTV